MEDILIRKGILNKYAICVERFLNQSFVRSGEIEHSKRISHRKLAGMSNIKVVDINYVLQNLELLQNKTVIIVRDDFGKFAAYLNPSIVLNNLFNNSLKSYHRANRKWLDENSCLDDLLRSEFGQMLDKPVTRKRRRVAKPKRL